MKKYLIYIIPLLCLCSCQTEELTVPHTIRGSIIFGQSELFLLDHLTVTLLSDQQMIAVSHDNPFEFANLEAGKNYTIRPAAGGDPKNGISTLDWIAVKEFIKGNKRFDPFQKLAADMNLDQVINRTDPDLIQSCMLTGVGPTWRFASPDFNGFGKGFKDEYQVSGLDSDKDITFRAIKMGDINGTIAIH